MLTIGVLRETTPGENRVAVIPETVGKLAQSGFEVLVESGAGVAASHTDQAYRDAKATVVPDARAALERADVVLKVREPRALSRGHEVDLLRQGATLIAFLDPARNPELLERLAARGVTAFAMEKIRASRAPSAWTRSPR
jgi:NAD/NADP transhydrogenase alpha subunit